MPKAAIAAPTRRPVTVRAWFDDVDEGQRVRRRLDRRGYPTAGELDASGAFVLTVTTPVALRAEVEGLIWLGYGRCDFQTAIAASERLVAPGVQPGQKAAAR